jgi:hypothetical protein
MKALVAVLALMAAAPAQAQVPDPMRPPDVAAAVDGGSAAASGNAGVQAVFLRRGAKPAALINGEYVVQGGKLGDRRVLKITEAEVVLRDAAGQKETMKVITGAEKTPVEKKTAVKQPARSAVSEGARGK